MKKVYILTGAVHTGKTTKLMQWALQQKNIGGIFQPVIDGKRFIYDISTRSLKMLETEILGNSTQIGNYIFSNQTFDWARNILIDCLNKNLDWIVIDEIGPLELNGKALEPTVSFIFSSKDKIKAKLLCVVRQEIFGKFVEHYQLNDQYEIFTD